MMTPRDGRQSHASMAYKQLLLLYPPSFRRRFGEEMCAAFAASYAAARRIGFLHVVKLWIKTVAQVIGFAAYEWRDVARGNRTVRQSSSRRRGPTSFKQNHREPGMSILHDLRLAARSLLRHPTFTLAAVITLALGVGANTAVFSVVHGVLWRPLPFDAPDELVVLWPGQGVSNKEAIFFRETFTTLEDVATVAGWGVALTGVDDPTQLYGARTSANVFDLLGTPPLLGRGFLPEDTRLGAAPVVVLSHALWAARFAADSNVLGRSILIDGEAHEVVGVMPASFEVLNPSYQLWIPFIINPEHWTYTAGVSRVIGRRAVGHSVVAAKTEFDEILERYRIVYGMPDTYGEDAPVLDYKEALVGDLRAMFIVLLGAVGFTLLIAGSNISSLMLSKAVDRRRDLALRAALGASRRRLIQGVLAESGLLSVIGGILGLVAATMGVSLLSGMLPPDTPRIAHIAVDRPVLLACLVFAVTTGILFGVAPALFMTRLDLRRVFGGARGTSQTPGGTRIRNALVMLQVALAVMLVVGAGLMIRSVRALTHVDTGFSTNGVLTLRLAPGGAVFSRPEQYRAFYTELVDRLELLPNIQAAGGVQHLPLSGWSWSSPIEIEGQPLAPGAAKPSVAWRIITGHYLEAMNIRLIEGRRFQPTDTQTNLQVGIVNQTMARRFWFGESPVGKRLFQGRDGETTVTVVGVVDDVLHAGLDREPVPELYRPLSQSTMPSLMLAVKTDLNPNHVAKMVQDEVWTLEPNTPISDVLSYEDLVKTATGRPRLVATLLTVFAVVALLMGATGVYGVASFAVSRRTNEIGIRRALGASNSKVRFEVLQLGVFSAVLGVVIGLVGATLLSRLLSDLVFGVSPTDPATFVSVAAFILFVAVAAAFMPAWRATRIDPVVALRE